MGHYLSNLEKIVGQQPTGSGEQNMIGLVPNIYGLLYVENTFSLRTKQNENQFLDELIQRMLKNLKHGYQRQVDSFKQSDGSYSIWKNDSMGSTWLTAYVMKSFAAASKYITIDPNVIKQAKEFLMSKQKSDGFFREDGRFLHKEIEANDGLALTVYCLISVLEVIPMVDKVLDKTISKVLAELPRMKTKTQGLTEGDFFHLSITSYALSLIKLNHIYVRNHISHLMNVIEEAGAPWESLTESNNSITGSPSLFMAGAYTLMTYIRSDNLKQALKVMKWLQCLQNNHGGYKTTTDTVLVLQAMAEFGIYFKNKQGNKGQVAISVPETAEPLQIFDIGWGQSSWLQTLDLAGETKNILVNLTGSAYSLAIVKIIHTYNSPVSEYGAQIVDSRTSTPQKGAIELYTKSETLFSHLHRIKACLKSHLNQTSGMYVASVFLPSGEVPADSVDQMLSSNPLVNHIEMKNDIIHFYMNTIPPNGVCVEANVERQMDFVVQKPGLAKFYSYYDPEYYTESLLDLSRSDECRGNMCGTAAAFPFFKPFLTTIICLLTSLLVSM